MIPLEIAVLQYKETNMKYVEDKIIMLTKSDTEMQSISYL